MIIISGVRSSVNYLVENVTWASEKLSGLFWAKVSGEQGTAAPRSLSGRIIPVTPPKNRDELNNYLSSFASPGEPPTADRPTLRTLDIREVSDLNEEDIQQLLPYFDHLYQLFIKTEIIVSLSLPQATKVVAEGCTSLLRLDVPKATEFDAEGCTSLQEINAPLATKVYAWECRSLRELNAQNLPRVELLDLGGSGVRSLPVGIGTLATLRKLDLRNSRDLTGIPREILDLPSTCTIDLSGCEFSESVRENLRRITTAEDYQGPQFSFSMPREFSGHNRANEKILQDLFRLVGEESETFHNLPGGDLDADTFNLWLNRLFDMADYKAKGDRQKALSENGRLSTVMSLWRDRSPWINIGASWT